MRGSDITHQPRQLPVSLRNSSLVDQSQAHSMAPMLTSTMWQSAIKFSSAAVKSPAYRALSATSVLQRAGLPAARRELSSLSWRPTARAILGTQNGRLQALSTPQLQKQVRWNSDEPETPPLRQWEFAEVCHRSNPPTNTQRQLEESNNLR